VSTDSRTPQTYPHPVSLSSRCKSVLENQLSNSGGEGSSPMLSNQSDDISSTEVFKSIDNHKQKCLCLNYKVGIEQTLESNVETPAPALAGIGIPRALAHEPPDSSIFIQRELMRISYEIRTNTAFIKNRIDCNGHDFFTAVMNGSLFPLN
jgi:hypothetical protein